jgi:hypothetical protein
MKHIKLLTLSLLLATPLSLVAATNEQSGGFVEAMQMPAWYQQNGETHPLKPGVKLYSSDVVRTGDGARILLRLEEGSFIKLGENGNLELNTINKPEQATGIFDGLLEVSKGAFRFTTSKISKLRKRDIKVKIGVVTVGIRGTDIWGKSSDEKDILCLIEGKITAQREGEAAFPMEDALSFYIVPKNKPALPVSPVPEAKLAKWAAQTDTQAGQGVLTTSGQWAVNLMSLTNEASADTLQQQLNTDGYAAELRETQVNGIDFSRVRIEGFESREDANSFAESIDGQYGIEKPWIVKFNEG